MIPPYRQGSHAGDAERLHERAEKARLAEEKAKQKLEKEQEQATPEFEAHEWLVE